MVLGGRTSSFREQFVRCFGRAQVLLHILHREQVIALARIALTTIALLAVYRAPFRGFSWAAEEVLWAYLVYTAIAAIATFARSPSLAIQVGLHAIDTTAVGVLLQLTDASLVHLVGLVAFALVAAALRWDWRAALLTSLGIAAIFLLCSLGSTASEVDVKKIFLLVSSLLLVGATIAYLGALRALSTNRLGKLAAWPTTLQPDEPALREPMRFAMQVLNAGRLVLVWKRQHEADLHLAIAQGTKWQEALEHQPSLGALVPVYLAHETFQAGGRDALRVRLRSGERKVAGSLVAPEVAARLGSAEFVSAPFARADFVGRLFALELRYVSDDLLSSAQLVADRLAAVLEQAQVNARTTEINALRVREQLARDVHDSVLQTLTAAALRLSAMEGDLTPNEAKALADIRHFLQDQQREIRRLIYASYTTDTMAPYQVSDNLRRRLAGLQRLWNCNIELTVDPAEAAVSSCGGAQIEFLVCEAISNAVRHGGATRVVVTLTCHSGLIELDIREDAPCLKDKRGAHTRASSIEEPTLLSASLRARIAELGGDIEFKPCNGASMLRMTIPVP